VTKLIHEKLEVFKEDHEDQAKLAERTRVGGPIQSANFMMALLRHLEYLGLKPNVAAEWTIHDYGCADGFGTMLLAATYPSAKVVGKDISHMYINRAKSLFPTIGWEVCDVEEPQGEADYIFSLHTLEHVEHPIEAIEKLVNLTKVALFVVVPPVAENDQTHPGGMDTAHFLDAVDAKFKDAVVGAHRYMTPRLNVDTGKIMMEHNLMMALKGALPRNG